MIQISGDEIRKLFVEPVLQGSGIGEKLLNYAVESRGAAWLWALEKMSGQSNFTGSMASA